MQKCKYIQFGNVKFECGLEMRDSKENIPARYSRKGFRYTVSGYLKFNKQVSQSELTR